MTDLSYTAEELKTLMNTAQLSKYILYLSGKHTGNIPIGTVMMPL